MLQRSGLIICAYPRVIEAEAEERQLEVEVLVNLLVRGVDVSLQVALILGASLIEEPVHEVRSDLCQSLCRHCVASSIVAVSWGLTGRHAIHWICKKLRISKSVMKR